MNEEYLAEQLQGYLSWLFVCSQINDEYGDSCHTSVDCHIPLQIDLFWHVHMLFPRLYEVECRSMTGYWLVHTPWPETPENDKEPEGSKAFKRLWGKYLS